LRFQNYSFMSDEARNVYFVLEKLKGICRDLWRFNYEIIPPPPPPLQIFACKRWQVPVPVAARSKDVGLRPIACWDCGFESHRGHGGLSVVSVVCCQVEVCATGWSLVQRSPTDCDVSLCVIKKPQDSVGHGPRWVAAPQKKRGQIWSNIQPCLLVRSTGQFPFKKFPFLWSN